MTKKWKVIIGLSGHLDNKVLYVHEDHLTNVLVLLEKIYFDGDIISLNIAIAPIFGAKAPIFGAQEAYKQYSLNNPMNVGTATSNEPLDPRYDPYHKGK